MLRNLAVIILLVAVTAQTFSKGFILLDYFAHTSSYAKNCENKAKPEMKCHGKCQMMKKMKAAEKKSQQSNDTKTENKYQVISSKSFFTNEVKELFDTKKCFTSLYLAPLCDNPAPGIFHPPIAV